MRIQARLLDKVGQMEIEGGFREFLYLFLLPDSFQNEG